jgi:hypothetical protein
VPRAYTMIPIADRFWAKVQKTDGCWLWTGGVGKKGYGLIGRGGKKDGFVYVHRLSYEINVGPIPDGKMILHTCDVRRCVRPNHLVPGTNLQNVQDMMSKGRHCHGEDRPEAKLTEADVVLVRLSAGEVKQEEMADDLGVSQGTISDIVCGRTWKHITGGHHAAA